MDGTPYNTNDDVLRASGSRAQPGSPGKASLATAKGAESTDDH